MQDNPYVIQTTKNVIKTNIQTKFHEDPWHCCCILFLTSDLMILLLISDDPYSKLPKISSSQSFWPWFASFCLKVKICLVTYFSIEDDPYANLTGTSFRQIFKSIGLWLELVNKLIVDKGQPIYRKKMSFKARLDGSMSTYVYA